MTLKEKPYLQSASFSSDADIDHRTYPYSIPAVRDLAKLSFHPDVTFLVGENGTGKSTVLEGIALALGFSPEGGTKNFQLSTTTSTSELHRALRLRRGFRRPKDGYFLRAESFFNVATYMDEVGYLDGYGGKSLHQRSHGEAFMSLLTHKFQGKGLYLLDEPEAALSPARQLAALSAIHQLVQDDSQFIIATHSPILLAYPNAQIWQFDPDGISEVAYEDTDSFAVSRDFLNNYPRRIEQLLSDL
ncbi:Predicted ATPase [Dyella sp. OK004]|nr:Predicted ATPase [Dyella sp. OK004]